MNKEEYNLTYNKYVESFRMLEKAQAQENIEKIINDATNKSFAKRYSLLKLAVKSTIREKNESK